MEKQEKQPETVNVEDLNPVQSLNVLDSYLSKIPLTREEHIKLQQDVVSIHNKLTN